MTDPMLPGGISRICLAGLLILSAGAGADPAPRVSVDTTMGVFEIELDPDKAPQTVAHFLRLVEEKRYDGTVFHRVIPGFVVQGGGKFADMTDIPVAPTVASEADNGRKNLEGTVALARFDDIDSASTEFFVNVADNANLDHSDASCTRADYAEQDKAAERGLVKPLSCATWGYTVFGQVAAGMETVFDIEIVETDMAEERMDVPLEPVIIRSIRRMD